MTDTLVELRTSDGIVRATPEHPFYVAPGLWITAEELKVASTGMSPQGEGVILHRLGERQVDAVVHNFEVPTHQNYFVSSDMVLVHNECNRYQHNYGLEYESRINNSYYGGDPAKKVRRVTPSGGRYLDNEVEIEFEQVGVESKYFGQRFRGKSELWRGRKQKKGQAITKHRQQLAERLRVVRRQANKDMYLGPGGVAQFDRIEWSLNVYDGRLYSYLRSRGLTPIYRP